MKISLIASSVRCWLWPEMMESLGINTTDYEVVLAGNLSTFQTRPFLKRYSKLRYIHTGNIKPAQCYEVARRNALGKYIMWIADDCEFSDFLLDNIVIKMESSHPKTLLSVKTNEDGKNNDLNDHRFFGGNVNTPLMAPLGVMDSAYLDKLGGFDRRYVSGQYENDVAMRVLADGGSIVKYEDGCVFIDHLVKHGKGTNFWTSYDKDREVLENSWVIGGYQPPPKPLMIFSPFNAPNEKKVVRYYPVTNREVSKVRLDKFEPYEDIDLLTVSQSNAGMWR